MTNKQAHEAAAGMGPCNEFYQQSGIDPNAEHPGPSKTRAPSRREHMALCILFFFACKAVGLDSEKARAAFLESELIKRFSVLTVDDLWRISEIAYSTEEQIQETFPQPRV